MARLDQKQIANEMRRTARVMREAGHADIADGNDQIAEYIEGLECALAAERNLSMRRTERAKQAERERDEARAKADRWDLLDSLLHRECASVEIFHHNPEFDGPNNVVTYRHTIDGVERDYRGDSVVDCLRQIEADLEEAR